MRRTGGVALAYTLLISIVLVVFVSALLVRVTQTLRFTRYDQDFVRARHLADSGARYAIVMMRDFDADFYAGRQPISSTRLGPELSPEVLGGTFEVQVYETSELGAQPYPETGTYRTIVSTGRSNGRTARTLATVKATSPLVNYLQLSRGDLGIGFDFAVERKLEGPILAVSNPALGQRGNVVLTHGFQYFEVTTGKYAFQPGDIRLAAEIKASGDIFVRNNNDDPLWPRSHAGQDPNVRHQLPPRYLEGRERAGRDLAFTTPDIRKVAPEPWGGTIRLDDDLVAEPNQEFDARIPRMEEIMERYREMPDRRVIDVSAHPAGVLVEFHDGKVSVSGTERRLVARLFDDDLRDQYAGQLVAEVAYQFPGRGVDWYKKRLAREVMWDDPFFPNAPYPDGRRDIDGNGSRESAEGDFFDVYRVVRTNTFDSATLSRDRWTVLYFKTSNTSVRTADGGTMAPPLFVRGIVRGKVVIVYDVTDDALDPAFTKLPLLILSEHEAPDDSPGNKIAGTPGIAGGLTYADRAIKDRPDATGEGSDDGAVLVSRGQVYGVGQPGFYLKRMRRGASQYDYRDKLVDRDRNYASHYGSGPDDVDFQVATEADNYFQNLVRTPFYGIAVESSSNPAIRLASNGEIVQNFPPATYPHSGTAMLWQDIRSDPGVADDYPLPSPQHEPGHVATFARRWRNALCSDGARYRLTGSLHGVEGAPYLNGDSRFDYKYQSLTADEIENEIGLPLSVVVVGWLRQ